MSSDRLVFRDRSDDAFGTISDYKNVFHHHRSTPRNRTTARAQTRAPSSFFYISSCTERTKTDELRNAIVPTTLILKSSAIVPTTPSERSQIAPCFSSSSLDAEKPNNVRLSRPILLPERSQKQLVVFFHLIAHARNRPKIREERNANAETRVHTKKNTRLYIDIYSKTLSLFLIFLDVFFSSSVVVVVFFSSSSFKNAKKNFLYHYIYLTTSLTVYT